VKSSGSTSRLIFRGPRRSGPLDRPRMPRGAPDRRGL